MSALYISIDGTLVASVCTDGLDVLTVNVGGTRIDENFADINVSGGSYPDAGDSMYLTWINQLPLKSGQIVSVSLEVNGSTSYAGKTIDELFPKEAGCEDLEFKPRSEIFSELRVRPILRDKFGFKYESKNGTAVAGKTLPEEHGFGFSVLWHSSDLRRAKVSLHSYSLAALEAGDPMNDHVREEILPGDWVRFVVTV